MRLALVVPWLEIGGVETFLFRLARCCQKVGYDVEIVATHHKGEWFDRARQLGIPSTCLCEATSFSRARHARKVGGYLRRRGFDVCFLNHTREAQASIAMLPDHVIVIPIIHNDVEEVYTIGCANRDAWNIAVAVSRKVFCQTRVLTNGKPVVEIPYGVELPPIDLLEQRDFLSRPLRVVYVGRLVHAQKGILCIPEILDHCRRKGIELSLCVIGDGPDRQALLDKAASLKVLDLIDMKGALPHEAIFLEMVQAHVLLMPSFYEGLPLVLLEAMAYGCVPIVSCLPGITDFAVDDCREGILAEIGNVNAFVSAITRIYYDRLSLQSMSRASRLKVEKRFSVATMAQAYLDLINLAQQNNFGKIQPRSNLLSLDPSLIALRDHLPWALQPRLSSMKSLLRRFLGCVPPFTTRSSSVI
jgi:glycosyltransferase involved in cell wall biosynthesis